MLLWNARYNYNLIVKATVTNIFHIKLCSDRRHSRAMRKLSDLGKKVAGPFLGPGCFCVEFMFFLCMCEFSLSSYSCFLPHIKIIHIRLIGDSELFLGLSVSYFFVILWLVACLEDILPLAYGTLPLSALKISAPHHTSKGPANCWYPPPLSPVYWTTLFVVPSVPYIGDRWQFWHKQTEVVDWPMELHHWLICPTSLFCQVF